MALLMYLDPFPAGDYSYSKRANIIVRYDLTMRGYVECKLVLRRTAWINIRS